MVATQTFTYLSNYIYNRRCQKYPRHFVRILRWSGTTQTKACFLTFVTKLKIEDHMFPFFPYVSSPSRNCPKVEGLHSTEMLHLNISEMLFNIKWAELKYPNFCNIFLKLKQKIQVPYVARSGNCRSSAPCVAYILPNAVRVGRFWNT